MKGKLIKQSLLIGVMVLLMLPLTLFIYLSQQNIKIVPLDPTVETLLSKHIDALIASDFSDLKGVDIQYSAVTESVDTVFFETYVKATTIFLPAKYRTYHLLANNKLAERAPSEDAVRAIIAHELIHIQDFMKKSTFGLVALKDNYEDDAFKRSFERSTDERTLKLGYGSGLKEFREWLYNEIGDEKEIEKKKYYYLTPEEIDALTRMM